MRKIAILPILLCSIILSGCWDRIEIDRRIFISTIGIDAGKDIRKDKEKKEVKEGEAFGEREIEKLKITFGYPDISKYSADSKQIPEDNFIKVTGYSMEDALEKATSKSSRTLDLGHTRLLVVSSDVFNYPEVIKEIMDYMMRSPKLDRKMYVLASEGRAEDLINTKLSMESNLENYIYGLMLNSRNNASILPVTLTEFLMFLNQNGNAMIPSMRLEKDKNELKLSGVSLVKDFVQVGSLSPTETSNLEILRGKLRSGKKVILYQDHPVDFQIDGVQRKIVFDKKSDKLAFNINIDIEGRIKGYYLNKNIFSVVELNKIENLFDSAITQDCEKVVKLLQREFSIDPIGLNEYLEKFHPSQWEKVKGDWGEAFKSADINVKVSTKIRRIGIIK